MSHLDPVHTGPDPYGHHINLTSFKTSMTVKFVIILQNLTKTYHRKSGKSKCDRKVTELNVEITRIRSRVNGVLNQFIKGCELMMHCLYWLIMTSYMQRLFLIYLLA